MLATERERERKERYTAERERKSHAYFSLSLWALNACLFVSFERQTEERERDDNTTHSREKLTTDS